MKYKGYELLKAIADGEIKINQKIRIIFKDNSGENFIFDGTDIIDSTYKNIFSVYGTKAVLKADFELIEDEIDIDSIEELGIYEKDKKFYSPIIIDNRIKINELVQAVKQINKEVKEVK